MCVGCQRAATAAAQRAAEESAAAAAAAARVEAQQRAMTAAAQRAAGEEASTITANNATIFVTCNDGTLAVPNEAEAWMADFFPAAAAALVPRATLRASLGLQGYTAQDVTMNSRGVLGTDDATRLRHEGPSASRTLPDWAANATECKQGWAEKGGGGCEDL